MSAKKIVLNFSKDKIDRPIIYKLIRDFDLQFNVLKASITPDAEGLMVLELVGEEKKIESGIKYLKEEGVRVEPLSKDIKVDWEKCIQCSACISICPTAALFIKDRKTMQVDFDTDKCIGCELCIAPCPPRAIAVHFQ